MDVSKIDSAQDLNIYSKDEHFKVYAGPGAGKTHLLVENIKRIVENSAKLKQDNRQILCITYTNAATEEIRNRLGRYNKYVYVSTIHSFLYDRVVSVNQLQLRNVIKNLYGMQLQNNCTLKSRQEGFRLLTKNDEISIRQFVADSSDFEIDDKISRTKIESCVLDIRNVNKYPFDNKNQATISDTEFGEKLSYWVKYAIFATAQKLDFDEILYLSYELLKQFRHIPYMLQYAFPYVLIDEYQDTNPIQNEIIRMFADNKNVVWGVIGDIAQSIYRFQGANYHEFKNFAPVTKKHSTYLIDDNRRSSKNIIHLLNYIRQTDLTISLQHCAKNKENNSKVKFVKISTCRNVLDLIPSDCIVLSRKWADGFQYIIGLSSEQQSIIKSIHAYYTYKMKRDMYSEIEEGRIDWIKISKFIVGIKNAMDNKCMAKMIDVCKLYIDVETIIAPSKHQSLQYNNLNRFISSFVKIKEDMILCDIIKIIRDSADECEIKLIEDIRLLLPTDEYYNENLYNKVNKLEFRTIKKMVNEVFGSDTRYTTIHRYKGLESDKVFVNFTPTRDEFNSMRDADINMSELICNPKIFDQKLSDEITEFLRIIYVGLSRAKNELFVGIDSSIDTVTLDASLKLYMKNQGIEEPFYEFI